MARALALLAPGWLLGGAIGAAKTKKRGGGNNNGKKKGKGKGKPKPKPKPSCSGGACAAEPEWAGNQGQIDHCEFICEQCDGDDPREFCIREGTKPDGTPTMVADCCEEGEFCCGNYCCPEGHTCCDGSRCCPEGHYTCCGGHCCGTDNPYTACCDGSCVTTEFSDEHCGACGNPCGTNEVCRLGNCECITDCVEECPFGQTLCDGECVNTNIDPDHCGGCGNACGAGQVCRDRQCTCPTLCPDGVPCIHNDGSLCVERPRRPDCHCSCPPGYKYCPDYFGHGMGACVSENSPDC